MKPLLFAIPGRLTRAHSKKSMFRRNRDHKAFVFLAFSHKLSEHLHTVPFLDYSLTVTFTSGHFSFLGNCKQHCIVNFSNVHFIGSCRTTVNLCTSIFILTLGLTSICAFM